MRYLNYNMDDVKKASSKEKFTSISLFAGIGGGCIGAKLAGGKILAINEFINEAQRVYKINFPETKVIPNDIRELSGEDIMNIAGIKKGELDILLGSPPCSSFSTVGKREEGWGEVKKYSDKKQRTDDLFGEFARVLKEMQPKFFVAENVASLIEGKAKHLFGSPQLDMFGNETNGVVDKQEDTFYHTLTRAGYKVRYKVLNSVNFETPQRRERLIIIGVRDDISDKGYKLRFPTGLKNEITLEDAFIDIEHTKEELDECNIEKYAVYGASLDTPIGGKSEKYFSLMKEDPNRASRTLTATAGCLSAASIVHWENRKFSVKEAIKIMGFPKDIYLGDTYPNKIERLGRAITPSVYEAVLDLIWSDFLKI
tara:strand:+ start:8987 stop:10093 length:1107 start_codon:yes stop_codon:yes gene_type:complete